MDVHAWLADPRHYERQIERLHRRYLFTRQLYELEQDSVSLAGLCWSKSRLARLIARTVARGEYEFQPARVKKIRVDGKERVVYALRLTDHITNGVVAALIDEAMRPLLPSGLYSYRSGTSWWTGVSDLAAYMRSHRRSRPDPRSRGLYVLRRDVGSYTDSIPVGRDSPLWGMLREILGGPAGDGTVGATDWALIQQVVRPQVFEREDANFTLLRGVPTGQPVACVLYNLYLLALDRELSAIPDVFYARYSDDIRVAHADPRVVRTAAVRIARMLAARGLEFNEGKSRDLYLTAAGRRSTEWPETVPCTWVSFLGCRVSASGTVALSRRKVRELRRDIEVRAKRTASAQQGSDERTIGRSVCAVVNRALDVGVHPFQQRSAGLLRRAVTDRQQLKQLDHWIARIVLGAVTGQRSVRAFRRVPYRTMREEWNLVSLVSARNRWPRR